MTTERKILYALGSLIIAGVITIGAFSLGVYVGKSGWDLKQPSLISPRSNQANDQNQVQEETENLPPKPDLVGKVVNINSGSIELLTQNGVRSVVISQETIYLSQGGGSTKPASWDEIEAGTNLAIIGELDQNDRTLRAEIVVILLGRDW